MTQEEKAKRYDEAIEKLRSLHDDYDTVSTLIDVKEELENIFPELAESDDEKIRKGIIRNLEYLMDRAEGFVKDELKERIAWLEKIGERGTIGNDRKIPNSAWSEEDEENMMMIEDRLSDYLDYIREDTSLTTLNKNSMKEEIIEYVNWLKSLKDRVQPKVELTQLDKNILEAAIAFVEQNNHFNCWCGVDKHTVLSALNSLRPHNTWKPSDEMLEALGRVIPENVMEISEDEILLAKLYQGLKYGRVLSKY